MRLGRTAFFHFFSQVIVSVAGFASRFAIAFFLGQEVLGQYSVATGIGFYWLVIPGSAVGLAINKRVSEGTDQAEYLFAGAITNLILAFVIIGILFGIVTSVDQFGIFSGTTFGSVLTQNVFLIAALAFVSIMNQTVMAGLSGLKHVALVGGFNASERVLRTCFQIGLIIIGFEITGLLLGHVTSQLFVVAAALVLFGSRFAYPTRKHFNNLFDFGKYAWISTLQGRVYGWMDVLVLSFFVSDGLIGIYEAAWGLGSLLGAVSISVRSTLFPEVSELAIEEEYEHIRHILGEGIVFSGIFVIPGLVGATLVGERVLEIYRPSFGKGATVLIILVFAYAVDVYGTQFVSALNALDRPDLSYRINFGFVVLNIFLNISLIWQFGWIGAAVATTVSAGVRAIWSFISLSRLIGQPKIPFRHIGYEIIAAILMGIVVFPISNDIPRTRLWTVLIVFIGAIIYVALLLIFSSLVRQKIQGLVIKSLK